MMSNVLTKLEYELIVFSDDWNGLPFSCKHLLKRFLPEIPIIWVETIGLRAPKFNLYDLRRALQKISGWFSKHTEKNDRIPANLRIIDPFQIPLNSITFIRKLNTWKILYHLNKLDSFNSKRKRVFLTTWPFLSDLLGKCREDISIYYRVDDFSEFPGVNKNKIIQLENDLMNKVDMIVSSAKNLLVPSTPQKRVEYLPHGVDYEHFTNSNSSNVNSKMFSDLPSPKIGFFGLLNSWIDFDLIFKIAGQRPTWNFILIGPSQLPQSTLPCSKNIIYTGPVDYELIPSCAAYFDVALIPFKINKLTLAVNPLKLMEYFAIGLPVVSTPLPEVKKYSDLVYIGSDTESMIISIEKALSEKTNEKKIKRKEMAQKNSWESKSYLLQKWIENELACK